VSMVAHLLGQLVVEDTTSMCDTEEETVAIEIKVRPPDARVRPMSGRSK
jgi:hypothetical protein